MFPMRKIFPKFELYTDALHLQNCCLGPTCQIYNWLFSKELNFIIKGNHAKMQFLACFCKSSLRFEEAKALDDILI